jgi:hypothetical protein
MKEPKLDQDPHVVLMAVMAQLPMYTDQEWIFHNAEQGILMAGFTRQGDVPRKEAFLFDLKLCGYTPRE